MKRFRHWLAHLLGWQWGCATTWRRRDGHYMMGFRCATCGQITGIFPLYLNHSEEFYAHDHDHESE